LILDSRPLVHPSKKVNSLETILFSRTVNFRRAQCPQATPNRLIRITLGRLVGGMTGVRIFSVKYEFKMPGGSRLQLRNNLSVSVVMSQFQKRLWINRPFRAMVQLRLG